MKLTETIVRRPVSAVVVIIGIVLFGVMSLIGMPQELTPEMNMPYLIVYTVYPTAGPEDVEKLVTREVEGSVSSLSGIKSVQSISMENVSMVVLEYEYGTDIDIAYTDVREKLDGIINSLPDTAQRPTVIEMDMNAMATISLSVQSENADTMLGYVEEELVPEFEKLSSVADVTVSGGREEYIRVELIEEKLQQYGVTMSTVVNSLSSADFSIPGGSADYGSQSLGVRSSVEYETTRALENIPVPLGGGNIIRLADVANIYDTTKSAESISRYNGSANIGLDIQKRQSDSAVTTSRQVLQVVEQLNSENSGFHIDVVNDNSESIQDSLTSVGSTLLLSIVLSMLVLFLFLGDFKASLIIGSSMPVSLLVAFIMMDFMGFTLNLVTMSSMVLGVGMMVDNSIVVLDSCFKSQSRDKTFVQSAIEGTKFVMGSIVGSTITTVVVFFPLATIEGLVGQMFRPLGFTIIFALTASLISAVTLVPLFFVQFRPQERRTAPAARMLQKVERGYGNLLQRILNKKKTAFFVSIGLVAVSLFMASGLNMELMPNVDQGIISISMETRPGLKLERLDELVANVEEMVAKHPDVETYTSSGGGSGMMSMMSSGSASVTAYLKDDSEMDTDAVIEQWRRETKDMLDCEITISSTSMTMQMSTDTVEVNLKGSDLDDLRAFSGEVEAKMKQHPDVITVSNTFTDADPQVEIVVDPMKAAAVSMTPMQVASNINMALSGVEASTMRRDSQELSIYVEYPEGKYNTVNDLTQMMLVTPTGTSVPLTDIASIEFTDTPQTIMREDGEYVVTVTATPTQEARFTAATELNEQVSGMTFPRGVTLREGSVQEMMWEELSSLFIAIIVAIWLVFMVMAIQFESIKHSLMVMICIPFSMIGSFALMAVSGTTISMVSLLGFLILVGTVVNNGILFVDTANEYRKSMDVTTALVYTGRNRLRPILMTTLTTILSMLPLSLGIGDGSEMMQGLGIVVIGGLTVSTILTLLLLPTFYLMIDGSDHKKQKRNEKRRAKLEQTVEDAEESKRSKSEKGSRRERGSRNEADPEEEIGLANGEHTELDND